MAIPTNFQGFTPNATVTKTHKILGSATVGIWACDVDGTFTPSIVNLAPNMVIYMGATFTDAQILSALQDFVARFGGISQGAAGGLPAQPSKLQALTSTTTT